MFIFLKKKLFTFWKTICWGTIMCYLLFSPGNNLPDSNLFKIPHADKVVHFAMFATLTFIYQIDSRNSRYSRKLVFTFVSLILLFGCVSEYIQYAFIPGRSGTLFDVAADFAGVIAGLLGYRVLKKAYKNL